MTRVISLLLLCVFVVTAVAADDGCCDGMDKPSVDSVQNPDQNQNTTDTDSKNCDCAFCFNCVRCGSAASLEVQYFAFSKIETSPIYEFYVLSSAPYPYLSALKRPPKS